MDKVLIILGPTAIGKTKIALEIADKLNGEIVSADSRQLYRYMDIGTAKPSLHEQKRIFHHLIDIINPDESFSAQEYVKRANEAINNIFERTKQPIVVGGSGLYIKALTKGFFEGPSANAETRKGLEGEAIRYGNRYLYQKLVNIDPTTANRIHGNDKKRIIRALEVYQLTGKTITELQTKGTYSSKKFEFVKAGLTLDRKKLYQRIDARVDYMLARGLLDEIRDLKRMGYALHLNALDTVGYKELLLHLQGHSSLEDAIRGIKQNTRNYAKRQLTWFRKDKEITWFEALDANLIRKIIELFRKENLENSKRA